MQRRISMSRSLVVALLATMLGPAPARASVEDNKQLVRRFTDEVYNQHKKSSIDVYVHPDFVDHSPGTGADARGIDYVKAQWDRNYAAFPDLRFTLDDVLAEGDKVVARWTSDSTFKGALGDVAGKAREHQSLPGSIT